MPYAEGRIYNDADSHIMESRDWLASYVDPKACATACRRRTSHGPGAWPTRSARTATRRIGRRPLEANLMILKGWDAYGANDPDERHKRARHARLQLPTGVRSVASGQFWGIFRATSSTNGTDVRRARER